MHVWVAVEPLSADVVRAIARAAARRLPTLDTSPLANARTGCVRPPGAPHRAGGWSVPVDRSGQPITAAMAATTMSRPNSVEAIERLAALLGAAVDAGNVEEAATRTIEHTPTGPRLAGQRRPCDVAELLAETPSAGRGHAHLARILVRLALARWSPPEVARLLESHLQTPGLVHLRRGAGAAGSRPRSVGERAALLARQWGRAVSYAATLRREEMPTLEDQGHAGQAGEWAARIGAVVPLVAGVREAITAASAAGRWSTQAGPSDRKALEYVLELALEAVAAEVELDCRRLALATGMGRSTAARALGRLVLDAWLCLAESGEGQRAHRYRILPQARQDNAESSVTCEAGAQGGTQALPRPRTDIPPLSTLRDRHRVELRQRRQTVAHDLYAHPSSGQPGLGRHLAATTAALGTGMYKVKDLAQATGYSPRTVRRHLERLQAHQIARHLTRPDAWRRTTTSLDSAARRIGATGATERRHRAYAIERDAYAWWLAELEWMRTPGKRRQARSAPAGQGRLILPGAPTYAHRDRYPRDHRGRADHRAARAHLRTERSAAA